MAETVLEHASAVGHRYRRDGYAEQDIERDFAVGNAVAKGLKHVFADDPLLDIDGGSTGGISGSGTDRLHALVLQPGE